MLNTVSEKPVYREYLHFSIHVDLLLNFCNLNSQTKHDNAKGLK